MKRIITGYWGNEPIWRYQTPEELLIENGIKPETAEVRKYNKRLLLAIGLFQLINLLIIITLCV